MSHKISCVSIGCANAWALYSRFLNLDNASVLCLDFQESNLPTLVRPLLMLSATS